ncbi:hypothetical protein [Dyella sp. C9]|uniref:hypothetical protein n=1 Tax=Dyella sp. C9 TaxID=2202154 RepID=UPI000DEF94B2|nr:hypothetical protein [Dyella sp. C9]
MNVQARNTALYCATLAGLLMLSACGKNEQQSENAPPAPAASAPAMPSQPAAPATAPAPATTMPAPASTAPAHSAASPGGMASAPATHDIKVAAVTLGNAVTESHAISKEQRHFAPEDKAIYASVATVGSSDNATLNAQWHYVDGKDQMFSSTTESIATSGPATPTFKVQNPNAWPQGRYKVVISLNGKAVASEDFEVRS